MNRWQRYIIHCALLFLYKCTQHGQAFQTPYNLQRRACSRSSNGEHKQTQLQALPVLDIHLPDLSSFNEISRQLTDALDIGADFLQDSEDGMATMNIPEAETSIVLESIGQDLLIFLASSVLVTLVSNSINISPILGYLVAGALLGPHGLDVFSNAKADVELGDFGILFLLFSEGLEVSSARLKRLTNYLPLGFAQISLTTGVITAAIMAGAPQFLDRFLPLDEVRFVSWIASLQKQRQWLIMTHPCITFAGLHKHSKSDRSCGIGTCWNIINISICISSLERERMGE